MNLSLPVYLLVAAQPPRFPNRLREILPHEPLC